MNESKNSIIEYSAKHSYQAGSTREEYERLRFSGIIGRYRYVREQEAVRSIINELPNGISMMDCPCGTGRWWPVLMKRARTITAIDISEGMRKVAKTEAANIGVEVHVLEGNAECLDLPDDAVDYTFSFALMKHLPVPIQYKILAEFSRISRKGVICSFGVFSHFTYEFWRRRHLKESYPVFREELEWMADAASLNILRLRKCTTPIGVEHIVLLGKA